MREQLQHFFRMMLVASLSVLPCFVNAQTTIGSFTYTFSGTEATIVSTSLSGNGAVVFPETVQYGGVTYTVTAIDFSAQKRRFMGGSPTSITGNSIKSITGGADMLAYSINSAGDFVLFYNVTSIQFPKLETIRNCSFTGSSSLTSISLPALKKVVGVEFLNNCQNLTSVNMPLLEEINCRDFLQGSSLTTLSLPRLAKMTGNENIRDISTLTTLKLPALTIVSGGYHVYNLPALTDIDLSALQTIDASHSFSGLTALTTLNAPQLATITFGGYNTFNNLPALTSLSLPKLMLIYGQQFLFGSNMSVINLPYGCEINVAWGSFGNNSSTSLTITGVTKIRDNYFTPHSYSLKHLSLPDLKEISGQIGTYITNIESIDMPNLETVSNCTFFANNGYNNSKLTTVSLPKLKNISNSTLFDGAPIRELTVLSSLSDGGSGKIVLNTYPTVVKVVDDGTTVNTNTTLFSDVKGGRFIVPKGKAAFYATKWNLPLSKTMVYSPVTISKSTAATLYASGSIASSAGSYTDGGTTYTNTYDLSNAMLPVECTDASVLGPNDTGFTPTLSTLTVSNRTNPWSAFTAYYAGSYADTPTNNLGELTLTAFTPASSGTVQGFSSSAASTYEGIGEAVEGFLFKGNSSTFSELYLPYVSNAVATPTINYLKAGKNMALPYKDSNNFYFYWHYGDASYAEGFYECRNLNIPEGRAYLAIPTSISSNVKSFRFVFDDENMTTGIARVSDSNKDSGTSDDHWYTLQGMRLTGMPTQSGVYIYKGKKVVVK